MVSRNKIVSCGLVALGLIVPSLFSVSAHAEANDKAFFENAAGTWQGPGEIVAGKYKGTKFTCDLEGVPEDGVSVGIELKGTCRVGVFKQPMSALISQDGGTYKGKFLDGAAGKGLDITSGNVSDDKIVVGILRKKLNGAMIARFADDKTLNVTISVKVEDQMIPVIGLKLNRQIDDIAVGSIK
jgi:hypothetical protein